MAGRQIIQVGLDGSWGQKPPHVFAYGGVAANQVTWNKLDPLWIQLLERYELTEFHMVDVVNFRGEFSARSSKWGEKRFQKVDEIVCGFIDVIREAGLDP